jgi:hypothetical protein
MNLKLSSKIAAALCIMVIMLAVVGGSSIFSSRSSLDNVNNIQKDYNRAIMAAGIENELTAAALDMRRYSAEPKDEFKQSFEQRVNKTIDIENKLLEASSAQNKEEAEKLLAGTKEYQSGILQIYLPAIKEMGGEMLWSLVVVDRKQGGGELLKSQGVESHSLVDIDRNLFGKALSLGHINGDQLGMILNYLENPKESMRSFLLQHPDFLESALAGDTKTKERALLLTEKNIYNL